MDRRWGAEGEYGTGGGNLVSEESMHNLQIAEDLCRKGKPNDAVPYLMIALKDKNNFDAEIKMAFLSPDLFFSVEVLESAEARARALLIQHLGADCFNDCGPCVGKFWDILLTRPYMRVLEALVRMYFETKQYGKAATTIIEMLRLCPGDNMQQRAWLGPLLIRAGRPADALFFCQTWIQFAGKGTLIKGGTAFRAPSDKLLSPDSEEQYAQYPAGNLAHTAALAAFKLWGPCPQAAQLLRIAARTNPAILARIIGRRAQPVEGKMTPRARNGPEDAHDYLWIAQDLWMEPAVWDWACTADPNVLGAILRCCTRPECTAEETEATQFKRCAACQQVMYCGLACQKADWTRHKPDCRKQMEYKKMLKNIANHKPPTDAVGRG
ncbi:hypothetical protein B0H17DRAFT_1066332 [Mycena rosella]|uniref:MYND-type domain-containing protein n=1 Tax=Mycena rosella TaxID=1033263 RepID=A0AAD7GDR3_MYCRO|nr:hypothetical protein B0H17DRAFT_1066332 [Mycena rosella]